LFGEGWSDEDGWQTRRGGDFVLYDKQPVAGTFRFTISPPGGGLFRRQAAIQWMANYRDVRNYVLYRLENRNLTRVVYTNGSAGSQAEKPHNLDARKETTLGIKITGDAITVTATVDGETRELDTLTQSGAGFGDGKFGFRIPSNVDFRMKDFQFTP
jgi:hypothetical protein